MASFVWLIVWLIQGTPNLEWFGSGTTGPSPCLRASSSMSSAVVKAGRDESPGFWPPIVGAPPDPSLPRPRSGGHRSPARERRGEGLDEAEATKRLLRVGPNAIERAQGPRYLQIAARQVWGPPGRSPYRRDYRVGRRRRNRRGERHRRHRRFERHPRLLRGVERRTSRSGASRGRPIACGRRPCRRRAPDPGRARRSRGPPRTPRRRASPRRRPPCPHGGACRRRSP